MYHWNTTFISLVTLLHTYLYHNILVQGQYITLEKIINCSHENLAEIPHGIPYDVVILDLNTNNIAEITPMTFRNMSRLTWLDLSYNKLHMVENSSFIGLSNLRLLNLSNNNFYRDSFEEEAFSPLRRLTYLKMNGPIFYEGDILPTALLSLSELETLEINPFVGFQFDRRFLVWTKLTKQVSIGTHFALGNDSFFGLSNCSLQELVIQIYLLDTGSFQYVTNLKSLDISMGTNTPKSAVLNIFQSVCNLQKLTKLSIDKNRIKNAFTMTKKEFKCMAQICLKELRLADMAVIGVDGEDVREFAIKSVCMEKLDLSGDLGGLSWLPGFPLFKNLKHFVFRYLGNPAYKDVLGKRNIKILLPKLISSIDISNIRGSSPMPNFYLMRGKNLQYLRFVKSLRKGCNGTISGIENVRFLDFSMNNCGQINNDIFQKFPLLETLIFYSVNLQSALTSNRELSTLFRSLSHLKTINLSYNGLQRFPKLFFKDQYEILHELVLSHNEFTEIPDELTKCTRLKRLDISYNKITTVQTSNRWIFDNLAHRAHIDLVGNPFKCFCENLKFLQWAKDSRILAFNPVMCNLGKGKQLNFSSLFRTLHQFENQCSSKLWLIFSLVISSVILLSLVVVVIYYRYKTAFQYFFLKLKLKMKKYEELNGSTYMYDVFISYNHNDLPWVVTLNKKLTDRGLKTCLDAKDFIGGDPIAENILRAIDRSRKVIFVVSRNFLKSTWGNYEIEITRMHAFQEGRDNMVIVIMKDDIPIRDMPKVLKQFWYKVTCIKWYDIETPPFQTNEIFFENVCSAVSIN